MCKLYGTLKIRPSRFWLENFLYVTTVTKTHCTRIKTIWRNFDGGASWYKNNVKLTKTKNKYLIKKMPLWNFLEIVLKRDELIFVLHVEKFPAKNLKVEFFRSNTINIGKSQKRNGDKS